jgi:hypothetical protein
LERFDDDPRDRAHFIRTRMKRLQSLSRLVPRGASWREMFLPPVRELKDLFAEFRDAGIVQALAEKYAPGEARYLRAAARPARVGSKRGVPTRPMPRSMRGAGG